MLEYLLNEIEIALLNEMCFISLQSALTIPDICSALASEDGKTNGLLYARWYDDYVKEDNDHLTGDDCYYYRCSCLHEGKSSHHKMAYSKVVFVYPNPMLHAHNNVLGDALNIDLVQFCQQMTSAARKWLEANNDNPTVLQNYEKLMKVYPDGLAPYVVGIPVIG